jgi:tetratricopeptide (TPR) repeat protein
MKKVLPLMVILFLIFALNVLAQGNNYFIKVKLSEDMKEASGIMKIDYINTNTFNLEEIYFRSISQLCQIKKATDIDGNELSYEFSENYFAEIKVKLKHPLESKKKLSLLLYFTSPVHWRSYYIYGSLQWFWYPQAIPYSQGKLQPFFNEIASYRVEVEFPADKTVVTSGEIVSEKKSSKGMKKIISQASNISNFGLVFFNNIEKQESAVEGIKLTVYYAPGIADWTKKLSEVAADIVRFYIKKIGFYPEKVINIIPGGIPKWKGGSPIASGIIAIHNLRDESEDFARWITAHEIGHYYWGSGYILTPFEYSNWLTIGLGIYTDRLYSEARSLDRSLHDDFRHRYLAGALLGYNTTLMQKREELEKAAFDWNNVIAHGKSFTVIEMLEQIVGPDTFHKIFVTLLERYKYKVLTVEDFQNVCQEIYAQDLSWFFEPWLYSNDKLDYVVSQVKTCKKGEKFLTQVEVKKTAEINMPIEVEITTIDEEKYSKIYSRYLDEGWIEFLTTQGLKDVRLDPSGRLPFLSRLNTDIKMKMIQYANREGKYGKTLNIINEVLSSNPENAYILYLQGQILMKLGRFDKALQLFQKVTDLSDKDEEARNRSPWCYISRGQIFDLQGRRKLALAEYKKAIELPDYQGSHEQAKKYLDQPYKEDEE